MIQTAQRHLLLVDIEVAAKRGPAPPTGEMWESANQHVVEHAQTPHQVELLVDHPDTGSVWQGGPMQAARFGRRNE